MKQLVLLGVIAGTAAGIFGEQAERGLLAATPVAGVPERTAEARSFPLSGRWRFADAGGLLPRNSGCGEGQAALTISPNAIAVERGSWRQVVYSIAEWRISGASDLVLTLSGSGSALMERARLTLDLSSAGFVRFRSATEDNGQPLISRVAHLPADRQDVARTELANLAGALTLIRCADSNTDAVALMRGPVQHQTSTWVLR